MWMNAYKPYALLINAAVTTSTTGNASATTADLSESASLAKRECKVVVLPGAMTTCTTATFAVEECDTTNGTYSAPIAGTTTTTITSTAAALGTALEMNVVIQKRYVHLKATVDQTGSIPVAAVLLALRRQANS
jgi:hypothetical protein